MYDTEYSFLRTYALLCDIPNGYEYIQEFNCFNNDPIYSEMSNIFRHRACSYFNKPE